MLTTIETIRRQLRNLHLSFITFGGLTCENFGSVKPIPETDFNPRRQGSYESWHNLNHYFERTLCCIMLSRLEYIVLCPVILWVYFGRSHGSADQVIVAQKYSITAFHLYV